MRGFFSTMALQPPVGQSLLIIEDSLSLSVRHTPLGMTPLDQWSARRRDLYLTKHNTHKRMTSIPRRDSNPQSQPVSGLQTHTLHCAATGYGVRGLNTYIYHNLLSQSAQWLTILLTTQPRNNNSFPGGCRKFPLL